MSGLSDMMAKDIDEVFFNTDEFAETHKVNGVSVAAIVDSDALSQMKTGNPRFDGTYKNLTTLYIRKSDMPKRPGINAVMDIDGIRYRVTNVNESGIWEITLEAVQ